MASEQQIHNCVDAMKTLVSSLDAASSNVELQSDYEADRAGFQLMELAFQHVDAISAILKVPKIPLNFISTFPLARSAFEVALTSYWLVSDEDWKVRETRWMEWMGGEVEFNKNLARDIHSIAEDRASAYSSRAEQLEERCSAMSKLHSLAPRKRRPNVRQLISECKMENSTYIQYIVLSQLTHGGPANCDVTMEHNGDSLGLSPPNSRLLGHVFKTAAWSIAEPGRAVLHRIGVPQTELRNIGTAFHKLMDCASELENNIVGSSS